MNSQLVYCIIGGTVGAIIGFVLWLKSLESKQMTNIIFRKNESGEKVFVPQNILLYMLAPIKHSFFWSTDFLQHNWIVMTSLGMTAGIGTVIGTVIVANINNKS